MFRTRAEIKICVSFQYVFQANRQPTLHTGGVAFAKPAVGAALPWIDPYVTRAFLE